MAETSKNKIYYNDDENSVADVLTDMKKLAQSVDNAIEKSKYNDTQIKKDISNMKTEITAKDNTQDNKILKLQAEKAELEKELKEAQEDFYQNSIRGQASGEYIHVEDSSNCRAKIGIGGNQEQETRAGYNKLNMSNAKGGTSGGITCVINEDGSYQFKGTATTTDNGAVNVWFLGYYNSEAPTLFTLEAGTYYINDVLLFSGIKQLNKSLTKIYTFTSEVNITGVRAMSATAGQTYNEVKYPIIAKSNKELTWEQYGVSPSLDYPLKVQTVGSNVNLFDLENYYNVVGTNACTKRLLDNGISINFTDGSDAFIGDVYNTGTTMTENKRPACIKVKPNTTYTLKMSSAPKCYMSFFDKNYKSVKDYVQITSSNYIFTTNSSTYYIYLRLGYQDRTSGLTSYDFTDIKCVEDTEVGEYSKHGQGCVKVTKCNKNISKLLGKDSYWQYTSRGIKNMGRNNGTRILEFELKKGQKVTIGLKLFSKPIKSTTFTIYLNGETNSQFLNINEYALNQIYKKEYTVTEDSLIEIRNWGNENSETYEFQLWAEIGSLTDYIQHEEQSYIMSTQREMLEGDYFDFDNEEEVHVWGNVIVNGTETINKNSNSEFFSITKSMSQFDTSATGIEQSISNYGTGTTLALGSGNTNNKYSFNASTIYLDCYNSNINTVEKLKVQLTKNNMKIYAKLATPNRLKFTDEQKAVAKELNNARTYKNVTNITTDSIAILDLDYAKDLEELTEYSTEERVIGRWIDGKPLYSKVGSIKFTSVYDGSGLHTRGSLIDSDIDYGTVSKVLNKNLLSSSLFNTYSTSTSNVYVENRQGNSNKGYILGFTDRTDLLNTTIYVVVEYTKTTD